MRGAGLALSGASIRHIDRDFILTREGDYEGLFFNAEIMGELEVVVLERGSVVDAARSVLTGPEPEVSMERTAHRPLEASTPPIAAVISRRNRTRNWSAGRGRAGQSGQHQAILTFSTCPGVSFCPSTSKYWSLRAMIGPSVTLPRRGVHC